MSQTDAMSKCILAKIIVLYFSGGLSCFAIYFQEEILLNELENEIIPIVKSKIHGITEVSPEEPSKLRWRQKREHNYEKVKSRKRRNLGQEYTSVKTRARELGSPCVCKKKM